MALTSLRPIAADGLLYAEVRRGELQTVTLGGDTLYRAGEFEVAGWREKVAPYLAAIAKEPEPPKGIYIA